MIPSRPSKRVHRDSPFAWLRELPRLGSSPVWNDCFDFDQPPPDWLDRLAFVSVPESHPVRRHLGFAHNDALIQDLHIGRETLTLTINHYDVERLAYTIENRPRRAMRRSFPVILRFGAISELAVVRAVEQGVYQKIRCSQPTIAPRLLDVVRIECLHYEEGCQRYVLSLNGTQSRFRRGKDQDHWFMNTYHVCVQAAELAIDERYRPGWVRLFGADRLDLLDAFEKVWPVPRWNVPDFERWVRDQGHTPGSLYPR